MGSFLYVPGIIWSGKDDGDLFLRKYTEDGRLVWEKKWDNGPLDVGLVIAYNDVNLYVGGLTRVKVRGIYTNQSLLQKYSLDGNLVWTKTWGDTVAGHHEIDGLAIVGNDLYASHWNASLGFLKGTAVVKKIVKENGSVIWSTEYGSPDKLSTTDDGHIYADTTGVWVTGRLNSDGLVQGGDAYLTKIDPNGKQLWIKTFGADGYDNALNLTSDGQYIYLTGMTQRAGRGLDAILAKFDRDGNKIWEQIVGGKRNDFSRGVAVDDKYLYVSYTTQSWGKGKSDTILAKYDKTSGALVDFGYWGDEGEDEVSASLILDKDLIYMVGKTTSYGKDYQAVLIGVIRMAN